jgi:hypothetical protein
VLVLTT